MNNANESSVPYYLFGIIVLVCSVVLGSQFLKKNQSYNVTNKSSQSRSSVSIDDDLQMTDRKAALNQATINVKNKLMKENLRASKRLPLIHRKSHWEKGVKLDQELGSLKVVQDLEEIDQEEQEISPEEAIYMQQMRGRWLAQSEEANRQAFADEFIERARKDGFQVILNDDLEVINVREIKNK